MSKSRNIALTESTKLVTFTYYARGQTPHILVEDVIYQCSQMSSGLRMRQTFLMKFLFSNNCNVTQQQPASPSLFQRIQGKTEIANDDDQLNILDFILPGYQVSIATTVMTDIVTSKYYYLKCKFGSDNRLMKGCLVRGDDVGRPTFDIYQHSLLFNYDYVFVSKNIV